MYPTPIRHHPFGRVCTGLLFLSVAIACEDRNVPQAGEATVDTIYPLRELSLEVGMLIDASVSPSSGNLMILDRFHPTMRVFDPLGDTLIFETQEGDGPGELRQPGTAGWAPAGPWAVDMAQRRVTQFDTRGRVVRTISVELVRLPDSEMGVVASHVLHDDHLLATPMFPSSIGVDPVPYWPVGVMRNGDLGRLDRVQLGIPLSAQIVKPDGRRVSIRQPIDASPIALPVPEESDGSFVIVTRVPVAEATFSVGLVHRETESWWEIEYQPVEPTDRVNLLVNRIEQSRDEGRYVPFTVEQFLGAIWVPTHLPAVEDVVVQSDGVWMFLPDLSRGIWRFFSFELGRITRSIVLPEGSALIGEVSDGFVISRRTGLAGTTLWIAAA